MSGNDYGKDDNNLSGVQKYGRKMRERELERSYTYSPSRNKNPEADNPASEGEPETLPKKTYSPGTPRPVKLKQPSNQARQQRFAFEKNKTRKEKKNSRFSTHGRAAIIAVFVILFIVLLVFSAFLSYTYLVDRTENPIYFDEIDLDPETTVKFKIEKGARTSEIVEQLEEMELIKNSFIFKLLSKFNGYDSTYKSGVHYLSKGLTYDEIMTILSSPPLVTNVTFPEGFTTLQMAERLEANNVCKAADFLKAINSIDVSSYSFLPQEKGDRDYILDGYLFPDTYEFEIDSNPETVLYKLLNRFNDIFKTEYFGRCEKLGLSVDQVITIASLVEKEAYLDSERDTIARVYYNRLISEDLKMLQCDATVLYAMKRHNITDTRITAQDLELDDPYNTYVYEGLPPGPICSPSEKSILAVITMDSHDYYYYVLKSDGSGQHIFSRTLEEHKAAVESQKQTGD